MAQLLEEMQVDVIEAGFPIASPDDFEAVRQWPRRSRPDRRALARAETRRDIDAPGEALQGAARPRLHIFLSTADAAS